MKTFSIIINDMSLANARDIIKKRLETRGLEYADNAEFALNLTLDTNYRHDTYAILGKDNDIEIKADCLSNIFAGAGAFLYNSRFDENGIIPSKKRGKTTPDCPYRWMYLSTHFHNFFHAAPTSEIETYLEDMALMGFNGLLLTIPVINLDRNKKDEMMVHFDRAAIVGKKCTSLGMTIMCRSNTSASFAGIPEHLKAKPLPDELGRHGNSGNIVCISTPGGLEHLEEDNRFILGQFKERGLKVDYIETWPYDEGGCGCPKCMPWGANGYLRSAKNALKTAREFFPDCKAVIAAWTFDTPEQGEWQGLYDSLKEEKWADMILADSHTDFPRFPLDKGVPGDLPLMAFPEISMWGLFPWGAYGAVAYPRRYTGIWRQTEGKLSGELLYSEGIYEDLNKYTVANLSKSFEYDVDTTLSDYAGYELGLLDTDKFVRLIDCIEENHYRCASKPKAVNDKQDRSKWVKDPPLLDIADEALDLAKEIDRALPEWGKKAWRWRIIYIRALLDAHRYRGEELAKIPECLDAMHELIDLYHCLKSNVAQDPYHHRVRPECPEY